MHAGETRVDGAKPALARLGRIATGLAGITLVLFMLDLLGVPVTDWISHL